MSTLGQRLRKARERKGWSQTYVCEKLKISNSRLSGYERDYREPDADMISTFADLYEVTTDWLYGRTDDPSPADKPLDDLTKQFPILADIDPELLQRFAEVVKEDPYQSLFFDDILSASKEEREQIVREWLELRKKYRSKPKDEPPEDEGPSAWGIIRGNKK